MKRTTSLSVNLLVLLALSFQSGQRAPAQAESTRNGVSTRQSTAWRSKLNQEMPLLGHRNWILLVDSAYPFQTSAGVETIDTGESMSTVRQEVLRALATQKHVRPVIYLDSELPYLTDEDVSGVQDYRKEVKEALGDRPLIYMPHDQIIASIDEVSKTFHILVLKTTLAIPYTSVFLQLDCKYWSSASEARLRTKMSKGSSGEHGPMPPPSKGSK